MAAVGPVLIPEMKLRGMKEGDLVALLATSAAMAETIPPSLVLIIIGSATGVSISALFSGGLLPAAIAAVILAIVVGFRSTGEKVVSRQAPKLRDVLRAFISAFPGLVLPLHHPRRGSEGNRHRDRSCDDRHSLHHGRVAADLPFLLPLKRVGEILISTASMSGGDPAHHRAGRSDVLGADAIGDFPASLLAFSRICRVGAGAFIAVSVLLFIVLGSALEGNSGDRPVRALLFPAARMLGINEVHYAMVVLLSMGLGLFSPPFGYGYYTACVIARVSPDRAMRNMIPYLSALVIAIILVAAVPWFSTAFLPH